jgi:hypothetical protein
MMMHADRADGELRRDAMHVRRGGEGGDGSTGGATTREGRRGVGTMIGRSKLECVDDRRARRRRMAAGAVD